MSRAVTTVRSRIGRLARALRRGARPAPPALELRDEPLSRVFGLDRGKPIDRHYIESFLQEHAHLIRGRTLEVAERTYSLRFGGGHVAEAQALKLEADGDPGTLVGDLTLPSSLPEGRYDCFVCTQTLNFIFDPRAAVAGAHRLLKPGGALLVTVAGISQISRYDMDRWGDFWRFTTASLEKLLAAAFADAVEVRSYGNVLAATAFLHGLAVEDLPDRTALDRHDRDYQVVVAAVAHRRS